MCPLGGASAAGDVELCVDQTQALVVVDLPVLEPAVRQSGLLGVAGATARPLHISTGVRLIQVHGGEQLLELIQRLDQGQLRAQVAADRVGHAEEGDPPLDQAALIEPLSVERLYLNNYFSIAKAKRDLGYRPLYTTKEAVADCLPYYVELYAEMKAAGARSPVVATATPPAG